MSTRTSESLLAAAVLVLSGCGQSEPLAKVDPKAPDTVACQLAGAAEPQPVCRSEIAGDLLTIRHPDGGFRRFRIMTDGHGLVAADGAEPARVTITDRNRIAVEVGGDRYDLPATVAAKR
ncbi:MAG: hypothetical protein QHC67_01630 [Sphingobium sp.]|uniref:hypothetical protein n=1 Tax=Sphingobium sp. TaxID=1912891 RepID=UPI0029BA002A|nr:hypothetical protein [Sphingobium sp.]MDX3908507.1 hypothetical protein [Sphingobium sp.]